MVASEETQRLPAVIRVMIADSRPFFSAGLRRLLSGQDTVEVVAEIVDVCNAPAALATPPDVMLLSHALCDDLEAALRQVRTTFPQTIVLLYGIPHTSDIAISALRLGVRGLIDEDASLSDLLGAVHAVASGQAIISPQLASNLAVTDAAPLALWPAGVGPPHLTLREQDVLRLVTDGLSNRSIAASFGLSEHTVRAHLREVMRKLDARSRIEAVTVAMRLGLIPAAGQQDTSTRGGPAG